MWLKLSTVVLLLRISPPLSLFSTPLHSPSLFSAGTYKSHTATQPLVTPKHRTFSFLLLLSNSTVPFIHRSASSAQREILIRLRNEVEFKVEEECYCFECWNMLKRVKVCNIGQSVLKHSVILCMLTIKSLNFF